MDKILIIAAHPDDDILGCGGFMAKYSASKSIRVIFIGEGTTCRYTQDKINSQQARDALKSRTDDARRALASLGVDNVHFYDNPCGRLDQTPIIDLNKIIEKELKTFCPDTVFTHSQDDVNNDHRIIYHSVQMATRPGGLYYVPHLYCFEIQSSTEWNFTLPFVPNHFEGLSAQQVKVKWDALACYETEVRTYPHPRSFEGVETLARYRGIQAGVAYCEAYRMIRTVAL